AGLPPLPGDDPPSRGVAGSLLALVPNGFHAYILPDHQETPMIIEAARLSLLNLFASETRSVFWKVLGLTILVLVGLWLALRQTCVSGMCPWFAIYLPDVPAWAGWLTFLAAIFAGIGLALALALLIAPSTALIAGLFLDDVAEVVEKRDY